eukprot:1702305-Rhodomonas_salina.1
MQSEQIQWVVFLRRVEVPCGGWRRDRILLGFLLRNEHAHQAAQHRFLRTQVRDLFEHEQSVHHWHVSSHPVQEDRQIYPSFSAISKSQWHNSTLTIYCSDRSSV